MLDAREIIDELFKRNGLNFSATVDGRPVYSIPGRAEYIFVVTHETKVTLGIYFKTGKRNGKGTEVKPKLLEQIDLCDPNSIKAICDWAKNYAQITLDPDK